MFNHSFWRFHNLRRGNRHALLQVPYVSFLSVDREFRTVWNAELLILSIFQRQNDTLWRSHMPHPACNGLHGGDRPWRRCGCDCALKFHSGLQFMNADFLAIDVDPGAV